MTDREKLENLSRAYVKLWASYQTMASEFHRVTRRLEAEAANVRPQRRIP